MEATAYRERRNEICPTLSEEQISRMARLGRVRQVEVGEVLLRVGVPAAYLYVVLSGSLEIARIVATSNGSREAMVTEHGRGQFSGQANMLSGRPNLVRCRVSQAGEVLEVTPEALRKIVRTDAELSAILMRAFVLRQLALVELNAGDALLVGSQHSADTLRLKAFLTRNNQPYTYIDIDRDPDIQALLDKFGVQVDQIPVVICQGETLLRNPSNSTVAECLGFNAALDACAIRDVVVIGAGPAGLAAAVYAASEGLDVLVLETSAPGGQAGTSSRIENYLGFPAGISGLDLAGRALNQAQKFGAEFAVTRGAARLVGPRTPYTIELAGGGQVRARAVVLACGAGYRKLPILDSARFEGSGIYYAATQVEARMCEGEEVIVVGAGNSAGQAAVFLSAKARHVHMVVRDTGLAGTMSRYLIRRIEESSTISVHGHTQIQAMFGETSLEQIRWHNEKTEALENRPIRHVFVMAGADPNTSWLERTVALDDKGFVKTGVDVAAADLAAYGWCAARAPYLLETSLRGVFAAGDVRSGSPKRVASAVAEGSMCSQMVHRALAE